MDITVEKWLESDLFSGVGDVFNVSIDRLTIVGDFSKTGSSGFQALLNCYKNDIYIKFGNGTSEPSGFIFNSESGSKAYFEIKNKKYISTIPEFRLDFNPNKLEVEEINFIKNEIMPLLVCPSFSRIDFAFDIAADLSTFFFENPFKKKNLYLESGKLETLNLGSINSSFHITIYNKKKEIEAKHKKDIPKNDLKAYSSNLNWWRVELKVKSDKAKIKGDFSPFDEDELFKKGFKIHKPGWSFIKDVETRLIVKSLIDLPDSLNEMSPYSRRKYKKILSEIKDYDYTDFLKVAYQNKKEIIVKECLSYFKYSEKELFEKMTFEERQESIYTRVIKTINKKKTKEKDCSKEAEDFSSSL